jgi:hypothetical protein
MIALLNVVTQPYSPWWLQNHVRHDDQISYSNSYERGKYTTWSQSQTIECFQTGSHSRSGPKWQSISLYRAGRWS